MLENFYQTVAQLSFTLLGLWWLVLQTKYREWVRDTDRRRMATNISLYFLLPGAMSLLALLASSPVFWQVPFIVIGVLGAVETFLLITRSSHSADKLWGVPVVGPVLRWAGFILYVLVTLVALIALIASQVVSSPSGPVTPLTVAGWLVTLLVVLGVCLAWAYFIEPGEEEADKA